MTRGWLGIAVAIVACASWSTPLKEALGDARRGRIQQAPDKDERTRVLDGVPSGSLKGKAIPGWVQSKPPRWTQRRKSPRERGMNPCLTQDPGFGNYSDWSRAPSVGQMIVPKNLRLKNGRFDLMVHFHGHEAARKEWVQAVDGAVLVGIDLGTGSGPYRNKFDHPAQFSALVDSVENAISAQLGTRSARVRRLGLSAWSAGYGALSRILETSQRRIDSVVLLDGLHTGYAEGGKLNGFKLEPFVDFARLAARGERLMFISHSSIIPPGYASTTETANYLIWSVGGKPQAASPRNSDPMGLELISRYSRGHFHVRGFSGNDTHDHCAHFGLYRDVLTVHIAPRWGLRRARSDERLARAQ